MSRKAPPAYVCGFDPSNGKAAASAAVVAHRVMRFEGASIVDEIVIDAVVHWPATGAKDGVRYVERVFDQLATVCERYRSPRVVRDHWAGDVAGLELSRRGVRSEEVSMTPGAQAERFELVALLIKARRLRMLDHPVAIRELAELRVEHHQQGRSRYAKRSGGNDDIADALALRPINLPVLGH